MRSLEAAALQSIMTDQHSFSAIWNSLETEVEALSSRFVSEWEAAWAELASMLRAQVVAFEREANPVTHKSDLVSLRILMSDAASRLLFEIVHSYRSSQPQQRALTALENYQAGVEDLVRRLPQTMAVPGADLAGTLHLGNPSWLRRFLLQKRGSLVQVPIRPIVESRLLSDAQARVELDGRYFLTLAKGSVLLLGPWQALRQQVLQRSANQDSTLQGATLSRSRWLERVKLLEGDAAAVSEKMAKWRGGLSVQLARALLLHGTRPSPRRARRWFMNRQKGFRYWSRQQRAVSAVVDLEYALAHVALELATAGEQALKSLDQEQRALLAELDKVIQWLQEAERGAHGESFPPPQAGLLSSEDRTSDWERSVEAPARERLPAAVETVEPRQVLPSWRSPWRTLEPQRVFLTALGRFGRETVLEGFREAEADHRAIVRDIERAREVVIFSSESAGKEGEEGFQIGQEGIANALSLISYRKQRLTNPHALVERKLAEATVAVVSVTHVALDQGRLGLLTQLAQQSGSKLLHEAWRLARERTSVAGRWARDLVRTRYHRVLQNVGWEAPRAEAQAPVLSQEYLGEVLNLRQGARNLPMIYQRLFRLAPVEEPRFLIGREPEMAALAQARSLWQSRRSVSVLLVGARGSGKTSLLNCAFSGGFPDATVVRGQFRDRVTTAAQMRAFLHELFGLREGDDLLASLSAHPRVVMIEEMERTFLRTMNGFEGLRELLSIISATSRNDHVDSKPESAFLSVPRRRGKPWPALYAQNQRHGGSSSGPEERCSAPPLSFRSKTGIPAASRVRSAGEPHTETDWPSAKCRRALFRFSLPPVGGRIQERLRTLAALYGTGGGRGSVSARARGARVRTHDCSTDAR